MFVLLDLFMSEDFDSFGCIFKEVIALVLLVSLFISMVVLFLSINPAAFEICTTSYNSCIFCRKGRRCGMGLFANDITDVMSWYQLIIVVNG